MTSSLLDVGREHLAQRLKSLCVDRPMGAGARTEYDRLLRVGTEDELADVIAHLVALDRWHFPHAPKLEPDELERCHQLMDEFVDAAIAARERFRCELERSARRTAVAVSRYEMTLADAEQRLERQSLTRDDKFPIGRFMLPWKDARALVRRAFEEALVLR